MARLQRHRLSGNQDTWDRIVPVSLAVNADPRLVNLATHSYVGRDLRKAYELVRQAR